MAHPTDHDTSPTVMPLLGTRVLVVDDDPVTLKVLAERLTVAGALVCTVASGDEAMEAIARGDADVLLSDLRMPVMSGLDLITSIRARAWAFSRLPAVAMTTAVSDESRACAVKAGFHGVIGKRMEQPHLVNVVLTLKGLPQG